MWRRHLSQVGWKHHIPKILLFGVVIGVVVLTIQMLRSQARSTDQRVAVRGAKASVVLNQEFLFPLKDSSGMELSKLKYVIESADLRDEIIVKGQRATAVRGRTFLILTIKIANDFNKALEVNVRDYVRLSVNNNEAELLAPDIHSDPVTIQAISTKYTRIGFPINDTDKSLTLLVGEINGNKDKVPLDFK